MRDSFKFEISEFPLKYLTNDGNVLTNGRVLHSCDRSDWVSMPSSYAWVESDNIKYLTLQGCAREVNLGSQAFVAGRVQTVSAGKGSQLIIVGAAQHIRLHEYCGLVLIGDVETLTINRSEKCDSRLFHPPSYQSAERASICLVVGNVGHLITAPTSKVVVLGQIGKWTNAGTTVLTTTGKVPRSSFKFFSSTRATRLALGFAPQVVALGSAVIGFFPAGDYGFTSLTEGYYRVIFRQNTLGFEPVTAKALSEIGAELTSQMSSVARKEDVIPIAQALLDLASLMGRRTASDALNLAESVSLVVEPVYLALGRGDLHERMLYLLADCFARAGQHMNCLKICREAERLYHREVS